MLYIFSVLVRLICLRHKGQKLTAAQLQDQQAVVGELFFTRRAEYERGKPIMLAGCLEPGTANYVTPPLDAARVTQIRNGGILITGNEQLPAGRKDVQACRQTWWCKPIGQ